MSPKSKRKPEKGTPNSPSPFKAGTSVEVSLDEPGFRGSWFTGTIVRRAHKKDPSKYLVEYTHLFSDDAGTKPLREIVDVTQLRPAAPREKNRDFVFSEEVDAFYNDGWWEGVITGTKDDGKFAVFFRGTREQIEFNKEDLRLHREWISGQWNPPLKEDNEEIATNIKTEKSDKAETGERSRTRAGKVGSDSTNTEKPEKPDKAEKEQTFKEGMLVEVSSDEDGFQGAWFAATVIKPSGKDKYTVEYKSLRTDDDTAFLREETDARHMRPFPPETLVIDSFSKLDEVDALYNDGWWVGVISKVLKNSRYIVYFKDTNEEMEFEHSDLRMHQDWIDGKWIAGSQGLKF